MLHQADNLQAVPRQSLNIPCAGVESWEKRKAYIASIYILQDSSAVL